MLKKSARVIVGLTTFYDEYLGVSIPGLAQIKGKFILVVYNDNPDVRITKKQIRKLQLNKF